MLNHSETDGMINMRGPEVNLHTQGEASFGFYAKYWTGCLLSPQPRETTHGWFPR